MRERVFSIIIFFACLGCENKLQAQPVFNNAKRNSTTSFEVTAFNNIAMKAILNGKDTVRLMFHTAENDVYITEDAITKARSIKVDGKVDSVQSWGGNDNSSAFSKNNVIQIGELSWNSILVWEDKNSGKGTDGKFGMNLFARHVIEMDFDKNTMKVGTKLPRRLKGYSKFRLINTGTGMFIQADCETGNETYSNKFLIHTGYSGGLLLDDQFSNENKLGEKLKITGEKDLKDAYGNLVKTKKAILPKLKIGNLELADVPAGFFEGSIGRQKISVMGCDILKRFNWIIDANREYIYLKPNHFTGSEYYKI
ncbi:MAG: hypothetical protein QM764_10135 [Chitinophagaceae bacterium]